MKKAVLMLLAALMAGAVANAQQRQTRKTPAKPLEEQLSGQGYGMAGCGLGSIIFGQQPGIVQVVAATFNATAANQTFAITSGTSNCAEDQSSSGQASLFIEVNRQVLANDASRGGGEALSALSKIYGCSNKAEFGKVMQHNYKAIFDDTKAPSNEMNQKIESAIKNDGLLAQSCINVG